MKQCVVVFLVLFVSVFAAEAPRAPQNLETAQEIIVPGPGNNLIRNGSFEGSAKYACQSGEWRKKRGRESVDDSTAAHGKYSLTKEVFYKNSKWMGKKLFDSGFEFAPFHCKWNGFYCVSFYAKADTAGVKLRAKIRGMHHSDNLKHREYPSLKGDRTLSTEWKRYHFFFPANRIKKGGSAANSYYLSIGCSPTDEGQISRLWIDGVQVEEVVGFPEDKVKAMKDRKKIPENVHGYPTEFKLYAPVEVCTETVNLPLHNIYTDESNTASVKTAVINGEQNRKVTLEWHLMDHRQKILWQSEKIDRQLQKNENWIAEQKITLPQKGAMLIRSIIRDENGSTLNFSDEPVTLLPFDLSNIGSDFNERFGINLSFHDKDVPDSENLALSLFKRLGFRWLRNSHESDANVDFAEKHGFNQFVSIFKYPKSVRKGSFPHTLPKDQNWAFDSKKWDDLSIETEFDKYLKDLATRYRGKVEAYQFGNETTAHKIKDPRIAWRVCRRAARVIRSIDPQVKIIGANIIYDWNIGWWDKVFALGGLDDMDYFGWDWDCYVMGGSSYSQIEKMFKVMESKSGGKSKAPFNYETGWGSGWMQDYPADPIGGNKLDYGRIPDEMVRCFARIFSAGSRHFVLHLAGYQENFMGSFWSYTRWPTQLYDEQERPRVILAPYNTAVKLLGLCEPKGRLLRPDQNFESYAFLDQRTNKPVVVYWSTSAQSPERKVQLKLDAETLSTYDAMGNRKDLKPVTQDKWEITIPDGAQTVYLTGPEGYDPAKLLKAFDQLPVKPVHIPTIADGETFGRDTAGGKWELAYASKDSILKHSSFKLISKETKGKHVWASCKNDNRAVTLGSHGKANGKKEYTYAGFLKFTPPSPGKFSISSKISVNGGKNNEVQIVSGIMNADGTFTRINSINSQNGSLKISQLFPNESFEIKDGQSLVISGWRSKHFYHGNLNLKELKIVKME